MTPEELRPTLAEPPVTIGIIAGSGQFPFLVARGARDKGFRVVICGFEDNTDPALAGEADAFVMLNIGKLGALIDFFKKNQASRVCMAGAISKPNALNVRPDFRAARLLMRVSRNKGDDAILRAVAEELESEGIAVVRPDALAARLHGPEGVVGRRKPGQEEWQDIRLGWKIAKTMGQYDIGQCVVLRSGIVIAVEAIEGTNAMLERAGSLGGPGCSLVKVVKPDQDERTDLPSIGLQTVELMARLNFACLAYEAGRTLFFDMDKAVLAANAAGIAIVGIPADARPFFERYIPAQAEAEAGKEPEENR